MPNLNSIVNSVDIRNKEKLDIIVIGATHERYESTLALSSHNFFSLRHGKMWDASYGSKPQNYHDVESLPIAFDYDLILCHTSDERIHIAKELSYSLGIPLIRHTHTLPQSENELKYLKSVKVDLNTFISQYSMNAWGDNQPSLVIEHGIDTMFWNESRRNPEHIDDVCFSVVNFWQKRDWACGWNIWREAIVDLPFRVAGKNPGLSNSMTPSELKSAYSTSRVFLNTSLNSPVPMSLLEAMACGCAVVSMNTCMIPEIIEHGVNGFLCDGPAQLNECCKMLLANRELSDTMGSAAARTIRERFNLTNFINNWNNVFYGVLS
jgi:glycosyltransferase involved in cell wall biosynthesis